MNGLIDIHTHIIPGVDDGAAEIEESAKMLNRYLESGFSTIIATPHMPIAPDQGYVWNIAKNFRGVLQLTENRDAELLRGTEVRLSPEIWLDNNPVSSFTLAGTRFLLVDFPSGSWPHYAEETLFAVQSMGLTPILAHPERYGWGTSHRDTPRDLVDRGVLLQVTLGSLAGAFGSSARSVARELLKSGLVHFTATDAHSAGSRMKAGIDGLAWLQKSYGYGALDTTLAVNPTSMLNNEAVHPYIPGGGSRFWAGVDLRRLLPRF